MFHRGPAAGIVLTAWLVTFMFVMFPATCGFARESTTDTIQALLRSTKVRAPEAITAPFLEGSAKTRVIVNLREPAGFPRSQDLRREGDRRHLSEAVRDVQDRFLPGLDSNQVRLTNQFTYLFAFSAEVTLEGLRQLEGAAEVSSIEEDGILHAHLAQGIPLINALAVRNDYNGAGLSIAICDTGIDYGHPRLGGGGFPNSKVIGGYDCGDDDNDPMDADGHGTCCAGIAAGDLGTSGDYIGGVAYGAKLYAVKIAFGTTGYAWNSDMIEGWEWCITHQNDDPDNPIMIISTSFGGGAFTGYCDGEYTVMTSAAANAVAAGITLFVSSGNDGYKDAMGWPACISHVISVGAVSDTAGDTVMPYSNSASFLGVFAPSFAAYTTDIVGDSGRSPGDYYPFFGGTSAACPYAAGAAACLQSASRDASGSFLSASEVRSTLYDTGDPVTDAKIPTVTRPRVNLGNAVNSLFSERPASIDYPAMDCDGAFTVSWAPMTDATSYTLERARNELFIGAQELYNGPSISYDEAGLSEATYWYRVRAEVNGGNSGWRAGEVLLVGLPETPSTLTVPAGDCDGAFEVNWSLVTGAGGYILERATNASFSDAIEAYGGVSASHNESGLAAGTYYYRVRADGICGGSDWKTAALSVGAPPSMPDSIQYPGERCDGVFTVTWSSVAQATEYVLERGENDSFSGAMQVYGGAATTYDEDGLEGGTYYYRVRAQDSCGSSEWRNGPAIEVEVTGVGAVSVGQTKNGSWTEGCDSRNRDTSYARYFTFSLSSLTQVQMDLMSDTDTVMFLLDGAGMEGSVITSDDDGGEGLNSRIVVWLEAGAYTVEATTFYSYEVGDFTLSLAKLCAGPNILLFGAYPSEVWSPGGQSLLIWSIIDGDTAWIDPGGKAVNATAGTLTVYPTTTTEYTLHATNECGGSAQAAVTVSVAIGVYPLSMPWIPLLLDGSEE